MDGERQNVAELECETVSMAVAARFLGISKATAYRAAARGELPAIRVRGRVLVLRRALLRMVGPTTDEDRTAAAIGGGPDAA